MLQTSKAFKPHCGLGCCPFYGGGSDVAFLLMYFSIPIVCGVLCLCFGMHYFVSIQVLKILIKALDLPQVCFEK